MEVIYLQQLLIEYLEKCNFLKIAEANFIFVDVKLIIENSRRHFFTNVRELKLDCFFGWSNSYCMNMTHMYFNISTPMSQEYIKVILT